MKKYFIIRNYTVEHLFNNLNCHFGGYDNISDIEIDSDVFVWFYSLPIKNDINTLISEVTDFIGRLDLVLSLIPKDKTKILFTIEDINSINWENNSYILQKIINRYNDYLYKLADSDNSIRVINFKDFTSKHKVSELIDWKYFYLSQMIINPRLSNDFQNWFSKKIDAIFFTRKKCLVLDLDNTLWGGILGEDGISGIKLGNTYPGNIYLEFQKNLKLASDAGVILTVCSKNNEEDVLELWEHHPDVILTKNDFSLLKINWNNKADNIIEIAEELNIGLDSIVFVDDNPSERELVKSMIPQIEVPDFPNKIHNLNKFFRDLYDKYFQIYKLTNEDTKKTEQYILNAKRNSLKKKVSFDDYLKSLETEVEVQELSLLNLERISQMTNKTNQFNLTTNRYTTEDITKLKEEGAIINCISVKDKFGNNGITGLIILTPLHNLEYYKIDTLLLSCRILGRNVEDVFLNFVINELKEQGISEISSQFIKSEKNQQVEDFYEKNGFTLVETNGDNKSYIYKIDLVKELNSNIKIYKK